MPSTRKPDTVSSIGGVRPAETRSGQIISIRAAEAPDGLETLRRNEERFRALLSSLDDLVFEQDREGRVLAVWTTQESLLTAPVEELLGNNVRDTVGDQVGRQILRGIRRALETGRAQVVEYRLQVPAGLRWFQARLAPIRGSLGASAVCALVRDVTDRKLAEEERDDAERRLRHQALHDALTGLPNRNFFFERLAHALERARRRDEPLAVLMLDLDKFKLVNDTFGHATGDEVLAEVANRLEAATRESDSLARLGGDEFAVIVPGATPEGVDKACARLSAALQAPIFSAGHELQLGVSIGVSFFPRDAADADALVRVADGAMYEAKRSQREGAL